MLMHRLTRRLMPVLAPRSPKQTNLPARTRRGAFPVEQLEGRLLMATGTFPSPLPIYIYSDPSEVPTRSSLYGSGITVRDLDGPIRDVRVTIQSFSHTAPEDVDILLMSPSGKGVIIMSDAGGRFPADGVDLTFSDGATRDVPENAPITSGVYRPTNYDDVEQSQQPFPTPAPEPPYETTLSAFAGEDPTPDFDNTGRWFLYVVDDGPFGDDGAISGWSLTITTGGSGPAAPGDPDLQPASDTGASNTDNVTKDTTPTFKGTASAGTEVRLFSDGVQVGSAPIVNGAYTITPEILSEGTFVIDARAVDAQGNEGDPSGSVILTIDTTVPTTPGAPDLTPDSDTGTSNTDNITTDTTPTFTGSAPQAASVTLVAGGRPVGTGTVAADGSYTVTVNPALTPGSYNFFVSSTDLAGNSSLPGDALPVTIQAGPPPSTAAVTQVFVNGPGLTSGTSANAVAFRTQAGIDATYGYAVPAGANQLKSVPWIGGINSVAVRFDHDVASVLANGDAVLRGVNVPTYATTFTYDPATFTAVWTTAQAITNDKLRLFIDDVGVAGLDGEWNNGADAYPSGDGTAGGDFNFRINVLGGDANQDGTVNALDLSAIKQRVNKSATNPGSTSTVYTVFNDITGDGVINALDLSAARGRLNRRLPTAEPLGLL